MLLSLLHVHMGTGNWVQFDLLHNNPGRVSVCEYSVIGSIFENVTLSMHPITGHTIINNLIQLCKCYKLQFKSRKM